jgi:hypothetical protein
MKEFFFNFSNAIIILMKYQNSAIGRFKGRRESILFPFFLIFEINNTVSIFIFHNETPFNEITIG